MAARIISSRRGKAILEKLISRSLKKVKEKKATKIKCFQKSLTENDLTSVSIVDLQEASHSLELRPYGKKADIAARMILSKGGKRILKKLISTSRSKITKEPTDLISTSRSREGEAYRAQLFTCIELVPVVDFKEAAHKLQIRSYGSKADIAKRILKKVMVPSKKSNHLVCSKAGRSILKKLMVLSKKQLQHDLKPVPIDVLRAAAHNFKVSSLGSKLKIAVRIAAKVGKSILKKLISMATLRFSLCRSCL